MIIKFKQFYTKSPGFIRQLVRLVPSQYRMGKAFRRTLVFIRESDKWSHEQYRAYQQKKLAELLELAINHVPYYSRYKRLLSKSPFDALKEIEPISKRDIQNDLERFVVPADMRRNCHATYTGGSSGYPLKIYQGNDVPEIEWAFMISQWMRAGYKPGDKRAVFRGVEFRNEREAIIRENPVYDEVILSPFHLTDDALGEYVSRLKKWKPAFLRGYPSALTVLARYIDQRGIENMPEIKALLCGSEPVDKNQRGLLERVFKARVYSWYGMTEKVVLAGECEKSDIYHCFPQYGITEIMDANGNLSTEIGTEGEIVGTGFLNRAMPFIRYRLEDYATIVSDHCEDCGRKHLLLSNVRGHRVQDVIIGRSGSQISMTAINMHDETFSNVRQFQFEQSEKGRVTLNLRVGESFDNENRKLILKSLQRKTGSDIEYDIQVVDRIDGTGMGKGVYLKQHIDTESAAE